MNNNLGKQLGLEDKLFQLVEKSVASLGFEVLDINLSQAHGEQLVIIRVDRLDEQPVTIDDLTKASRATEEHFDTEDPIQSEYRLEFESPGGKRPLLRARHFERMLGLKAKVKSSDRNFTAPIKAVNDNQVTFEIDQEEVILTIGTFRAHLAEFPDRHR